jgi:competence protein ComEC
MPAAMQTRVTNMPRFCCCFLACNVRQDHRDHYSRNRNKRDGRRAGLASLIATSFSLEAERWMLWFPVFLASGIGLYFALPAEPPLWLGLMVLGLSIVAIFAGRSLPILKWLLAVIIAASLGFAAAQWRTALVAAPVLAKEQWADFSGQVLDVEADPPGARITLDHVAIAGVDSAGTPARIRVLLPASVEMPSPGDWLALRAKLGPPSRPVLPGGFDFQRLDFFRQVGAVGIATRDVRRIDAPDGVAPGTAGELWATAWREISAIRVAIAQRILAVLSGDSGTIAVALIAGDQYNIPIRWTTCAFRLRASVRSPAAYPSARRLFAVPAAARGVERIALLADQKWAGWPHRRRIYVLLAGAPISTLRSFIMAGSSCQVMFDRVR